jgi:uncharacterized protein (DUF885 family)
MYNIFITSYSFFLFFLILSNSMDIIKQYGPFIATKLKMGLATNLDCKTVLSSLNPDCESIQYIYSDCFESTQKNASLAQHEKCLQYCIQQLQQFKEICNQFKIQYPNQAKLYCNSQFESVSYLNQLYQSIETFCKEKNYFNSNINPVKFVISSEDMIGPHYRPDVKSFVINKKNCMYFHPSFMTILLCHECLPGHHYMNQHSKFPLFKENDNIALIEGWGFYAERFCPETIENYYAYSCCKTIHLIRAIIDIHYTQIKDWNKKDALTFITQNWPFSITSEQMENEIKNIDERPGYQICYIIGEKFYDQCFKTYASQFSTCKDYHNTLFQALNTCKDCSTQSITSFFKTV